MPDACYVYAITGRGTPLPATAGATGTLAAVAWRELAAVTGSMRGERAPLTMEAVRQHEAVVEAVRRQGPALPVRFGTVFRDAAAIRSALAARYESLASDLDRLGDKVELSLTALWTTLPGDGLTSAPVPGAALTPAGAGARYLHARAAEFRRDEALNARARAVGRELDRGIGAFALARHVSFVPTPRVALRATYLLDPAAVGAFKGAFEATLRAKDEVRLLLTGPWPPYSFVRRPEPEGAAAPDSRFAELTQLLAEATRGRHD